MNPDGSALIHQSFESVFDSPRTGRLGTGDGTPGSIWIQDDDAVDLTYQWTNTGMFAIPRVRTDQVDRECLYNDGHDCPIPFGFTEVTANPLY